MLALSIQGLASNLKTALSNHTRQFQKESRIELFSGRMAQKLELDVKRQVNLHLSGTAPPRTQGLLPSALEM